MSRFQDLAAFQRSMELVEKIYEVTESFPKTELYGLTSQLRRASISVMSGIAEGEARLTPGEWRQMLSHARGSLFEVEAQLLAAQRLRFLDEKTSATLNVHIKRTGAALLGLIRFVQSREARPRPPSNPATP
ncbi:MAG TPA: four helix bundle protein [Thermoanaerobaculia bacterium]|jgi:four helix bundle protein